MQDAPSDARLLDDGARLVAGRSLFDVASGTETMLAGVAGTGSVIATSDSDGGFVFATNPMVALAFGRPVELVYAERADGATVLEPKWRTKIPFDAAKDWYRGARMRLTASVSPDGRFLSLSKGDSSSIEILDNRSGAVVRAIDGTDPVFVPGAAAVLVRKTDSSGQRLWMWPIPAGEPREITAPEIPWLWDGRAGAAAFSSDGKLFAIAESAAGASRDKAWRAWRVYVWEWPGLVLRATLPHTAPITSLRFRNDAGIGLLTSTPSDATIHAWKLADQAEFARVPVSGPLATLSASMVFTPSDGIAFVDAGRAQRRPTCPQVVGR